MIYRCKACGANLEFFSTKEVVRCEYCSTMQTLPNDEDERKIDLLNRANTLRLKNEFDLASSQYLNLLNKGKYDSEIYWGLVLCKYGIEYVEDKKTNTRIPTCHRTQFKSILEDEDYLETINLASKDAKEIYEKEAKVIDEIQKKIIEISQKEEPYDVFICYKESDQEGNRTIDSVIAQEIYERLIEKEYKVFFSRISLETKLGQEYEPIIFAALRSAKVMLVVGTKEEYFNAVWVKNEWSRYISFMKNDRNKYLIPCYKGINPYDMPEEFISLQSQDLNKIGYMQDLIRGIEKLIGKPVKIIEKTIEKVEVINTIKEHVITSSTRENKFKRALALIEEGSFSKANEVLERMLDDDYMDSEVYFYQIFAVNKCKSVNDFIDKMIDIENNELYHKALEYANDEESAKFRTICEEIKDKINYQKNKIAFEKANERYNNEVNKGLSIKFLEDLISELTEINKFYKCKKFIDKCQNKLIELKDALSKAEIQKEKEKKLWDLYKKETEHIVLTHRVNYCQNEISCVNIRIQKKLPVPSHKEKQVNNYLLEMRSILTHENYWKTLMDELNYQLPDGLSAEIYQHFTDHKNRTTKSIVELIKLLKCENTIKSRYLSIIDLNKTIETYKNNYQDIGFGTNYYQSIFSNINRYLNLNQYEKQIVWQSVHLEISDSKIIPILRNFFDFLVKIGEELKVHYLVYIDNLTKLLNGSTFLLKMKLNKEIKKFESYDYLYRYLADKIYDNDDLKLLNTQSNGNAFPSNFFALFNELKEMKDKCVMVIANINKKLYV